MSKSLGNYICVDEAPEAMYEKVMRIPDDVLVDYYRITTDLNLNEVSDLMKKGVVEAHKLYAREIIKMYHNKDAIKNAEERYSIVASSGVL